MIPHYFYRNRDEITREREKKNFISNSVPSQPGMNIPKNIDKKIKKLKNIIPVLFQFKLG